MKAEFFNIFNDKQLEAIKLIIKKGMWGNTDMEFGTNKECNEAFGYFTNMNKGKEFSGLLSGISKTIKSSGTAAIKMCPDWWGDGSGDMMFFNMDLLECSYQELEQWAEQRPKIDGYVAKLKTGKTLYQFEWSATDELFLLLDDSKKQVNKDDYDIILINEINSK